ncbi:MAG: hypothetical protein M3Q70_01695 [bacterium]|nr:hypothetical protein [bacterium]
MTAEVRAKKPKTRSKVAVALPAKKTKKVLDAETDSRKRKSPKYKHFRLQKKIPHPKGAPAPITVLIRRTATLLKLCWKPLLILSAVFAAIQLLFVYGLQQPLDVRDFRDTLDELFQGSIDNFSTIVATFSALFGAQRDSTVPNSNIYSSIVILFFSLMFIWIYRQKTAGNKFTVLQAVYRSPYPITVVLGVMIVIAVQMLPFAVGSVLFSTVMQGEIAINAYEKAIWWIFLGLTVLLSGYLISSSLFAVYIATLPNMTPLRALRSARNLVRFRRFSVMNRLFSGLLLFTLAGAGVLLPLIFFLPTVAGWAYFVLSAIALPVATAFIYTLYRDLL